MAELRAERNTLSKPGERMAFPAVANVKIYKGAVVVLGAGYAKLGTAATGMVAVGMALDTVDNTYGQPGDKTVTVRPGIHAWANSYGGDVITQAEVGSACYVVDDQTVAKTDGTGTRSRAGKVLAVDVDGVWVRTGILWEGMMIRCDESAGGYEGISGLVPGGTRQGLERPRDAGDGGPEHFAGGDLRVPEVAASDAAYRRNAGVPGDRSLPDGAGPDERHRHSAGRELPDRVPPRGGPHGTGRLERTAGQGRGVREPLPRGTDEEADEALRRRCLLRWYELTRGATKDAYIAWALAVPGVTDVAVHDRFPRGEGTVDVIITGPSGPPSSELVAAAKTYIEARRPICSDVLARGPRLVQRPVRLRASIPVETGDTDATRSAILHLLNSLLATEERAEARLRIGQWPYRARLAALAMSVPGVFNVVVESPATDEDLQVDELFVAESVDVQVERAEP